jgi:cell division protein FtsQ
MRRPAPLPPPPPREQREADTAGDVVIVPVLPGGGSLPNDPDAQAQPPSGPSWTAIETTDAGTTDAGPADADDAPPLSARDVWAAARARRKALRAEVRRFTARQRHRRMVWIGVVASVLLLVLGSVGAAYSPLFAVERVRVVGTSELPAATVESALAGQLGKPLPLVDPSEVKAALVAFPLVESYTLEARPPHELVVRIVERTPIGSLKSAAGYTLVDAAGVALSTTDARPDGYPAISVRGGVASKAFTAIGTVFRSLPDEVRAQVTSMKATSAHDVTLTLGDTDTDVMWGDASESAKKSVVLQRIMLSQPPSEVSVYDVSSPNAVVVR